MERDISEVRLGFFVKQRRQPLSSLQHMPPNRQYLRPRYSGRWHTNRFRDKNGDDIGIVGRMYTRDRGGARNQDSE
jgi:hypothetical protein